jgi:hypothetical protein
VRSHTEKLNGFDPIANTDELGIVTAPVPVTLNAESQLPTFSLNAYARSPGAPVRPAAPSATSPLTLPFGAPPVPSITVPEVSSMPYPSIV